MRRDRWSRRGLGEATSNGHALSWRASLRRRQGPVYEPLRPVDLVSATSNRRRRSGALHRTWAAVFTAARASSSDHSAAL